MRENSWFLRPFGFMFYARMVTWTVVLVWILRTGVTVRAFTILAIFLCVEMLMEELVKLEFHRFRKRIELLEAL